MNEDRTSTAATAPDDEFGPVVYRYTRAQALADGVLVDVTGTAAEAGFQWPVALTRAAWEDCVAWSDEDNAKQAYQDQSGRLRDVLFMAFVAVRRSSTGAGNALRYRVLRIPRNGRSTRAVRTELKLVSGPGDEGEPVLTIMLPNED